MVRKGRLTKDTSSLPQISLKTTISGSYGGRFLSQVNHPKAPGLLSVDRRVFLAGFLQKPVLSEHPQRSDSSGELWGLCPPAFSASSPPQHPMHQLTPPGAAA